MLPNQRLINLSTKLTVPFLRFFFLLFFFFFFVCFSVSLSTPDYNALLSFKANTDLSHSLSSWVNSTDPCIDSSWIGVTCNPTTRRVAKLVLENLNLTGSVHSLSQLTELRLLSLKHNHLSSSSSSSLNLSSWPNLKHLYLSHNRFAEEFPTGIVHLPRLQRLDISHNNFYGDVPMTELVRLPRLLTLRLESNSFTGTLNSSSSASIIDFNVSNNKISGEIPEWMSHFPASSFMGNKNLAGPPLPVNFSSPPTAETASKHSDCKAVVTLLIVPIIGALVLAVLVMATLCVCVRKRRLGGNRETKSGVRKEIFLHGGGGGGARAEEEGLVVFEGWNMGFKNVGELLKCSAELLGKGSVGTTYKVEIDGGVTVVVKRVRDRRRRRRREVEGWLEVIGGLRHENVVSLRAYYNSADEMLLVYDYLPNGSLHALLHGNRGPWRTPLDWPTRLNLASAAAKGLAFLHNYNKTKLFHGHLTSSNIMVDQLGNACLADIGLDQLLHAPPPPSANNAYIAPELNNGSSQRVLTQKADVYSFGVILLEILTGRMVAGEEEIMSLVKGVQSVGREELTGEVFDIELLSNKDMEEEMVALLQISLLCLAQLPKDRPKMNMIHRMIEDITTKGVRHGGENFIMMHDLSSDSSGSTPRATRT